jgi:LmbE family N-acetylglucosaminyl deacetylase
VALVAITAWCAAPASAALPCVGADIYVVAHQDDTLLFQSPDLLEDVRSNRCIRTVFTTAGDAGKAASYWEGREAGAEAAYAQMAGVPDVWQGATVNLAGHAVQMETLVGRPGISILYLRLPDGMPNGNGFPMYGEESLKKLWNGGTGQMPAIGEIEADDGSAKYTYAGLIDALSSAIASFGARQILTQNYAPLNGEDHSDHLNTARFVKAAAEALPGSYGGWHLVGYEGYETAKKPVNLGGELLAGKEAAFETYVPFDSGCPGVCGVPPYTEWRHRQYVAPSNTRGVVASAGHEQTVGGGAPVVLNGAGSSSENGAPVGYSWTQVGGPPVVLNGSNTVAPALVTPPHPTVLSFALTVNQGLIVSAADVVRVRVPGVSPNPAAVAGPDQSVGAGARVTLDGSASWDPESLPLSYGWSQVGGPAVVLTNPGSSTPTFTAPSGAASTLTFSLVVANGTQASAPATVRVAVAAAPSPPGNRPPETPRKDDGGPKEAQSGKLARQQVQLTLGRPARRVVRVNGNASAQSCRGRLPVGALCRINPAGNVVVETRRSLSRSGTFHLTVRFAADAKPAKRPLKVVIKPAKK